MSAKSVIERNKKLINTLQKRGGDSLLSPDLAAVKKQLETLGSDFDSVSELKQKLLQLIDNLESSASAVLIQSVMKHFEQILAKRNDVIDSQLTVILKELSKPASVDKTQLEEINKKLSFLKRLPSGGGGGADRYSVPYAIDPVAENVASAAETSLTACTFTPTFPAGTSRFQATLHAYIHAATQAAGGHKVGLTLQYSKDGGAYADLVDLTANPPLVLPNLDEAMSSFAVAIDITTELDTTGLVYGFKWLVDSDNAGSVNYTSNFEVVITFLR